MKTEQLQLMDSIKNELSKDQAERISFLHSVYFQPKTGRFIYNDQNIKYDIVEPLIQSGVLRYLGFETHQGEKMLRYSIR